MFFKASFEAFFLLNNSLTTKKLINFAGHFLKNSKNYTI